MAQKRVLITGVRGGIGAATAQEFANAGWHVIGVDREEAPAIEHCVNDFRAVDISASAEVAQLFEDLSQQYDYLDALVNNAAVQMNKPIVDTTDEDWELIINTNVRSAFQCTRNSIQFLRERRGSVVNVSSVHAVATSINVAVYAISKGALAALTRSSAVELASEGIRCNAVLPGAIDTAMLRDGLNRRPHPEGPEGNLKLLAARTPLGFVAKPEEITPSILHLADGAQSPYTTGQTLIIDGGATIRLSTE